ncbi:DUF4369 domain-containing protein [Salinimicrobium xinjiangense]|uniref:DUF4369 domain-containing protein n=1 Tax=Salinimicrobium xinjiangense TaxID=438596 RepID=UPI0004025E69|nr:DUF4369 domain-containing protein [Salinimicrobium xinjiangense]
MKRFGLFILLLSLIVACSGEQTNLEIQGKVQGLKKGTIFLQKIEDTTLVTIDSVIIKGNENFTFKTFIESPQVMYLYLNKKDNSNYNDRILFFAEPGKMIVNTTLKNFEGDVVVEGSENQKKLMEYEAMMQRFNTRNLELIQKNIEAQQLEDNETLDSTNKEFESLIKRRYLYTVNFALNNNDREIAPYLAISEIFDANLKYLDTIYSSLTPEIKESYYGKSLEEFLEERREMEKSNSTSSNQES